MQDATVKISASAVGYAPITKSCIDHKNILAAYVLFKETSPAEGLHPISIYIALPINGNNPTIPLLFNKMPVITIIEQIEICFILVMRPLAAIISLIKAVKFARAPGQLSNNIVTIV